MRAALTRTRGQYRDFGGMSCSGYRFGWVMGVSVGGGSADGRQFCRGPRWRLRRRMSLQVFRSRMFGLRWKRRRLNASGVEYDDDIPF